MIVMNIRRVCIYGSRVCGIYLITSQYAEI